MDKNFTKGVIFTLVILSLFGMVFAIGFHTANEITTGTFSGDYEFNGNVDFTNATIVGNGSSSVFIDFPDLITCDNGNFNIILMNVLEDYSNSLIQYRYIQNPTGTGDYVIKFNSDGTYNSQTTMTGYDCLGKSIQQLYDEGKAFNLVGGFDNHKINCPTGFTSVESQGRQLGCMQNDEEGTANWYVANDNCFDNYGGTLPSWEEWHIAMRNYNLLNEIGNREWTNDVYQNTGSAWRGLTVGLSVVDGLNGDDPTTSVAYRCFIRN